MRKTPPVYATIPGGGRYRQLPDGRYERLEGPELDGSPEEAPAPAAAEGPEEASPPTDDGGAG